MHIMTLFDNVNNQYYDFFFFNQGFWTPSIHEIQIWTPCYENPGLYSVIIHLTHLGQDISLTSRACPDEWYF